MSSFGIGITVNPCLEVIAVIQKGVTSHAYDLIFDRIFLLL